MDTVKTRVSGSEIAPAATFVGRVTIDCLDKKKSVFDPDLPHIIDKYVFQADRLDYSLFKIPETRMGEILTVEGVGPQEEEFKHLVEKHGLKGLRFEKLWSEK